jgi:predicted outer membrane repeat protein
MSQNNDSSLTLSELAENVSNYHTETNLVLQQGNHILQLEIVFSNISSVSIIGSGPPSGVHINCERQGRLSFESIDYVEVSNLIFNNCKSHQVRLISQFMLKDCLFQHHFETAMTLYKSSGYITNTSFISNSANRSPFNKNGGAMIVTQSNITIDNCTFCENSAERGGAIVGELQSTISLSHTEFEGNHIKCSNLSECFGGALYVINSSHLSANNCKFHSNSAHGYAKGGVIAVISGKVFIQESVFALTDGGVMFSRNSYINISASIFRNNTVSFITVKDTIFMSNEADQGIIYLIESTCNFQGNILISDNTGSLVMYYSNATFKGNTTFVSNRANNNISTHFHKGGAITAIRSSVIFQGQSNLSRNTAENGGAIHAIASKLYVHSGTHIISSNRVSERGGGIYLFLSELKCEFSCKIMILGNSAGKGGGTYAIASIVTVVYGSLINFTKNNAGLHGGGIYLEVSAKLNILMLNEDLKYSMHTCSLSFTSNLAGEHGGAVYVADETDSGTCNATMTYSSASECFLQAIILSNSRMNPDVVSINSTLVNFLNNHAESSGPDLFGGLLDRCTLSPFAHGRGGSKLFNSDNSFTYFQSLSNVRNLSHVSSRPVRVCFCKDSQLNCSYQPPPVNIQRGGTVRVSLVAVNQANQPIIAKVHSFLSLNKSGSLGEQQHTQNTSSSCTNLSFTVASPQNNDIEELVVYADGPCKDAIPSQRKIRINFDKCTCPTGFQEDSMETSKCVCECDTKLTEYNSVTIARCDFQTITLEKITNSWLGYSKDYGYNYSGYLIHLHCPQEYCKHPNVNFSFPEGVDVQCKSHRSGVLCGTCSVDYSISLGSANCIACPNYWPAQFIGICILFFLSGLLLVTFILALNLTVAVGTLNGIIFYANIVAINKGTFFTFSKPNYITVFISWLNLDFGFDVCFIKNLDAYWKTWLQLAFPTYIIFLVVMIIIISQRSEKFSQLIGRKNPVATLAMLIFLSYAKILSIIIVGLSCTTLIYSAAGPYGEHRNLPILWLADASVRCFHGRHIILFIAALFILFIGIAYTLLLFSWQWLLFLHNKFCSSCTRVWIVKLSMFIETYHAPYTPKHRYWTGLLLLVRVFLYIASTANVSDDPRIDLLIIGIVLICILLIKEIISVSGRVYKKWPVEILEVSCYVNLILLCFATLYELQNKRFKECLAYTSVSIIIIQFIGVLLYHITTEIILRTKNWKRLINKYSVSPQCCLKKIGGNNDTELIDACMHTSSMADVRERSTSIFTPSNADESPYFNMDNEPTY